ncbi:murein L,D-transpeptidase [Pseudahrensia aquimaris]|uniref:Murein L,D-transpeptidase n=1 Tax=Pseudahrensia aquimaris TaxID=744461 RepID=A0ABW3FK30_9HYPH
MRHFLAVLTATSMLTVAPPVFPDVAEASSLFETLFPRTAERRRARAERRRQQQIRLFEQRDRARKSQERRVRAAARAQKKRRAAASKPAKVKGAQYHKYKARNVAPVALASLAKPFEASRGQNVVSVEQPSPEIMNARLELKRINIHTYALLAPPPVEPTGMTLADASESLKDIRLIARKNIGKALIKHYSQSPEFMWIGADGRLNEQGDALIDVLADADAYGLRSNDYQLPPLPNGSDAKAAAAMEFALTARALRYIIDARHGVVDPNRISDYHDFAKNYANADKVMATLAFAAREGRADETLLASHPKEPAFAALKAELDRLQGLTATVLPPVRIASGTFLRPGDMDPELENIVEAIRRRASDEIKAKHAAVLEQDHSLGEYTPEVVALVRDMQKALWLKPDGIVGKNTIRSLLKSKKASPAVKRERILLAMERMRWHPSRFGDRHVFINQASYRAAMIEGGREKVAMNVVVGKKSNQTYFFHDNIDYVEFNPYWGIPRSILVNEMLPKLRKNASYFDRLGYEVTTGSGRRIASSSIDWWSVGANFPYNVRQPPGPRNALGRLKIMFPNSHAIYMHDTPAKSLFSKPTRAYSHGCVRLERPEEMAAAVLGTTIGDVENEIAQGENKTRQLNGKLPVYVSYFTAWPNADGSIGYYSDVYGRDAFLRKALQAEHAVRDQSS